MAQGSVKWFNDAKGMAFLVGTRGQGGSSE